MPGLTAFTAPYFFQAGQSNGAAVDVHCHGPASARPYYYLRLVFIELGLGDPDRLGHVLIGQRRVDDLVSVVVQEGRFHAADCRVPAVKEENLHAVVLSTRRSQTISASGWASRFADIHPDTSFTDSSRNDLRHDPQT